MLADKTIKDANIGGKKGVINVALKKKNGKIIFNPDADAQIGVGDKLAVIGEPEHFSRFEKMARGKRKKAPDFSHSSLGRIFAPKRP